MDEIGLLLLLSRSLRGVAIAGPLRWAGRERSRLVFFEIDTFSSADPEPEPEPDPDNTDPIPDPDPDPVPDPDPDRLPAAPELLNVLFAR